MATYDYTTHAPISQSAHAAVVGSADDTVKVIAQRIARLDRTHPAEAAQLYQHHASAMTPPARALFNSYIAFFAAEPETFNEGDKVIVTEDILSETTLTGIVRGMGSILLWIEVAPGQPLEPVNRLNAHLVAE